MNIENEIFKDYLPIFKKLNDYGFYKQSDKYQIIKSFMNNEFNAKIFISKEGFVRGKVYDFDGQEYIPLRIDGHNGAFIGKVRDEYKNILSDIREKCFIHKSKIKTKKEWLIPANPKIFDIDEGFRQTPELEWHQFGNVNEGDTIYIYMAAPISAIIYKCEVVKANLLPNLDYPTSKTPINRRFYKK